MRDQSTTIMVVILLLVLVSAVFQPLFQSSFILLDDTVYVTENATVKNGLTKEGFLWAFTTFHAANWHPITWISHMLDVELFGLDPRGHHLVNILLHAASTVLLFLVLNGMTGAVWPSALTAALFGVHPLHVESVAWVAERKDVLSGFLWMLTMGAYLYYTRKPCAGRYLAVIVSFTIGLMAKPMIVTLPFVLLLLDWWPLGRLAVPSGLRLLPGENIRITNWRFVLAEKIPLLALATFSSIITYIAQKSGGAMSSLEPLPLTARLQNALVSWAEYLSRTVWPRALSIFYPHQGSGITAWEAAAAAGVLVTITAVVFFLWKFRYLPVGWLWYLGTLVPVIGLIQVGGQGMADRYTYLPLIGIFAAASWSMEELAKRRKVLLYLTRAGALIIVAALSLATVVQAGYWRNSETIFSRALAILPDNWLAHNNLGEVLYQQKRLDESERHFREAIRIKPTSAVAHFKLGNILSDQSRLSEAIYHYQKSIFLKPDHADSYNNLCISFMQMEMPGLALNTCMKGLKAAPNFAELHNNTGVALQQLGKPEEGMSHFIEALKIKPDYPEALCNLGLALELSGKPDEAIASYQEALRLKPDYEQARSALTRAPSSLR